MATHSSILAWKIPWTVEPGRLQSMGLRRVGHNRAASLTHSLTHRYVAYWIIFVYLFILLTMTCITMGFLICNPQSLEGCVSIFTCLKIFSYFLFEFFIEALVFQYSVLSPCVCTFYFYFCNCFQVLYYCEWIIGLIQFYHFKFIVTYFVAQHMVYFGVYFMCT